ncbi:MAG: YceI family protein [Rhodospirillaceae bacterium]
MILTEPAGIGRATKEAPPVNRILASLALALALASPALAAPAAAGPDLARAESGSYAIDKSHAKIIFSLSHFGFSTYYGLFTGFDAKLALDAKTPAKSNLEVTVDIASVATTNPKLDEHLKSPDFLDAAKFPTAVFKAGTITVTGPAAGTVAGTLTLHGVTKPVVLKTTFNGGGINPVSKKYVLGFDASTTIKRSEFGIVTYVPMVGDEVTLTISGEFNRAP